MNHEGVVVTVTRSEWGTVLYAEPKGGMTSTAQQEGRQTWLG